MEVISEAIALTCPMAFGGASGGIFMNAVMAVVAAYCTIISDYRWPSDNANDIIAKFGGGSYDFIIVGAGTAGSIVASRLSNIYTKSSVLLIEAGEDPGVDSEIPAFLFLNQRSNNVWSYVTEPDGRSCLSFKNKRCIWSKGKGMGGSSSINAMLYIRGHPQDFNDWKQSGNHDWGYDQLKYYFDSQEELFNVSVLKGINHDGWYKVIDEAWQQLGFKSHKYDSNEALIGTKRSILLIKDGKRLNTAKIVLNQALNLHVMKNTTVEKIILDEKLKLAKGVKIRHLSSDISMEIIANKEVILSAGSIASPQLLMLSGIGSRGHLEEIGIQCYLDLPVGKNLQDHITFPLFLRTNKHVPFTPEMVNLFLLEYMLMRTGPISNIGITDYFGFVDTKNLSSRPNIQYHHMYFSKYNGFMLKQYLEGVGYNEQIINGIIALNNKHDILGIYPTLLHPKSRGKILLKDSSSKSKPIIRANYLEHPDDMQTLIEAIEFVHKLEQTEAFKALDLKILELNISNCPPLKYNTDPYWRCYIRHLATTIYHPVGTAKMGSSDTSVVDSQLLVRGMNNLRVVDASIMPSIPGSNTMASTLAIANKAVDIITTKHMNYKEDL